MSTSNAGTVPTTVTVGQAHANQNYRAVQLDHRYKTVEQNPAEAACFHFCRLIQVFGVFMLIFTGCQAQRVCAPLHFWEVIATRLLAWFWIWMQLSNDFRNALLLASAVPPNKEPGLWMWNLVRFLFDLFYIVGALYGSMWFLHARQDPFWAFIAGAAVIFVLSLDRWCALFFARLPLAEGEPVLETVDIKERAVPVLRFWLWIYFVAAIACCLGVIIYNSDTHRCNLANPSPSCGTYTKY